MIEKYLAGALSQQEIDAFDEHTFYCKTCFTALRFHEEMVEVLAQPVEAAAPSQSVSVRTFSLSGVIDVITGWARSPRFVPLAIGAAAAVVIAVLGFYWLQQQSLDEQRRLFAANSQAYPMYERLVDDYRRAGTITVESPKNGFNCRDDLVFAWQRESEDTLYVKIFSNTDELLHMFATAENRYIFKNAAVRLQPGLYYWKLEDEEEMKYVGKFFVKKPE